MDSKVMTPELDRIDARMKEFGLVFVGGQLQAYGGRRNQKMSAVILELMRSEFALQDQLAALSTPTQSAPVGEGWRPIESAPRDGTCVLAGSTNHDAVEAVCWQDGLPSGSTFDGEVEEGWVNDGPIKDRFYANPRWFTHWQPLPAPPASSPRDQGGTEGAK